MTLYLRLLFVAIAAMFGRSLGFLEESRLKLRVWPHDIDANLHMTNARYLSVMDLGRVDLLLRTGMWRPVLKNRWQAVLGATTIRYLKPLKPFQAFEVVTRVLCWDDRRFYLEQRVEADGRVAAVALMQGVFIDRNGRIAPSAVVEASGASMASPPEPDIVRVLRQHDLLPALA